MRSPPDGDEINPTYIEYPGFTGKPGDTGGAPSPSGRYLALTNASSGSAKVYITKANANANGSAGRLLTSGYQPDWQPLS